MPKRQLAAFGVALVLSPALYVSSGRARAQVQPSAPDSCGRLKEIREAGLTITAATAVAPGAFVPGNPGSATPDRRFTSLPAFCRVEGRLTPSPDSSIGTEVWLPSAGWNGRFQAVGGRALGGI